MQHKSVYLSLAYLASCLISVTSKASVTISPSEIQAFAADTFVGNLDVQVFNGNTVPTHTTLDTSNGGGSSKNAIDWLMNGGQTIFSLGIDHQRVGLNNSSAGTFVDPLLFTADSDQPYTISGYYNVTDIGMRGPVIMFTELTDLTIPASVFLSVQQSWSTTNEQFVLGEKGGDEDSLLSGSLSGNLIAGHTYRLKVQFEIIGRSPEPAPGTTALGNLTLKVGTAVPEPFTLLLLGIAAISSLGYRKAKSPGNVR